MYIATVTVYQNKGVIHVIFERVYFYHCLSGVTISYLHETVGQWFLQGIEGDD